jgi:hypothetical protein
MADDVMVTIRVDGGVMPGGMLDQMMREQGVLVTSRSAGTEERGGIAWSADAQMAVTALVVNGAPVAIKAALATFRKRFPKAMIEIEDDGPDDGGFLG